MTNRGYALITVLSRAALTLLLSTQLPLHPLWPANTSKAIPGNTDFKHCDEPGDPLDPADDLFDVHRLIIEPNPPQIGEKVAVGIFGDFKSSGITSEAQLVYFVNAIDGDMAGWDMGDFCNVTTTLQLVNGSMQEHCPPAKGPASIAVEVTIEEYWPAGRWYVLLEARNGNTGDDARLFCVDGEIDVLPPRQESKLALFGRLLKALLPTCLSDWKEGL